MSNIVHFRIVLPGQPSIDLPLSVTLLESGNSSQFLQHYGPFERFGIILTDVETGTEVAQRVNGIHDWQTFLNAHPNLGTKSDPFLIHVLTKDATEHQRYREFRGPLASKVRTVAGRLRLDTAISRSLEVSNGVLLRRAYSLSMFGIIPWEFLELGVAKGWSEIVALHREIVPFRLPHQFSSDATRITEFPFLLRKLESIQMKANNTLAKHISDSHAVSLPVPTVIPARMSALVVELAWMSLLNFRNVSNCAPEAQLLKCLWTPLLDACLITQSAGLLVGTSEFFTDKLEPELKLNQRIDYVACFQDNFSLPPLFLVEGAGHPLGTNIGAGGFYHKDYRKLACTMSIVLRQYMGAFSENRQMQKQLVVFGAFIAGSQIQYCLMFPVFPASGSGKYSLIFQTTEHWRNDFALPSSLCTDNDCAQNLCCAYTAPLQLPETTGSGSSSVIEDDEGDETNEAESSSVGSIETENSTDPEEREAEGDPEPENPDNGPFDGYLSRDISQLGFKICSLATFCAFAIDRIRFIKTAYDQLPTKHDPERIPPGLLEKKYFPASSSKHENSSPAKTSNTPYKGRKRARLDDSTTPTRGSSTRQSIVIKKSYGKYVLQEIEMLKNLSCCSGIVKLLHYKIDPEWVSLYEERLIEWPDVCKEDIAQLFPTTFQYVLDIGKAIEGLRHYGIIHRDISPNNIMYSPSENRYKLIDFDMAVYTDETGNYHPPPNGPPCGTETCIAPELFTGSPYSWKTDMYALGVSYFHAQELLEDYIELTDEHEHMHLAEKMQSLVMEGLMNEDPSERWTPKNMEDELLPVYAEMASALSRRRSYIETWYDVVVDISPRKIEDNHTL